MEKLNYQENYENEFKPGSYSKKHLQKLMKNVTGCFKICHMLADKHLKQYWVSSRTSITIKVKHNRK